MIFRGFPGLVCLRLMSYGNFDPCVIGNTDDKEFKEDILESKKSIQSELALSRAENARQSLARSELEAVGLSNTDEALQLAMMMSMEESGGGSGKVEDEEEKELREILKAIELAERGGSGMGGKVAEGSTSRSGDSEERELQDALDAIARAESVENRHSTAHERGKLNNNNNNSNGQQERTLSAEIEAAVASSNHAWSSSSLVSVSGLELSEEEELALALEQIREVEEREMMRGI